jgi:hypothetical protein
MRKADESRKALQRLAVAVFLVVGVMLSFNYAFAAEGTSNTPNTAVENDTQSTDASGSGAAVTESGSGPSEGATAAGDADAVTLTAAAVPTVTISNSSFADSGTYEAQVTGTVPAGTKYVWQRSVDGATWTDVIAKKVTGNSYNVDPDATKATSINIALDSRVIGNNSTDTNLYSYRVQLRDTNGNVLAMSDSVENPYYTQLQNGGFESPDCSNKSSVWNPLDNGTPGLIWQTTASQGVIEIGNSAGNSSDEHSHAYGSLNSVYGTTAKEGNQFAELNADEAGALYQDVMTVPNSTLYWSLYHKARSMHREGSTIAIHDGYDTMYVLIMPTSYAQNNVTTQIQVDDLVAKVLKDPDSYKKNGIQVTEITDDTKDWYYYTGDYVVPSGQYLTRYFFAAGATITGDKTVGNFLDGVSFSTHVPDPTPDTGNVTVTKTVTGLPADSLKNYKVTVTLSNTSYSHTFDTWAASEDGSITNSYTFTNVPAGTYTVSETVEGAPTDYTETQTFNKTMVTVGDRTSDTVEITNAYAKKTGRLTISKKVSGAAANKNEEFTFQLSCDDLKGQSFGDVTFNDTGVATISLSDGQKKDIQGIPADVTIAVQEIKLSGKAGTSTNVSKNGTAVTLPYQKMDDGSDLYSTQAVKVTVNADSPQQLNFTNTANLEPSTGLGLSTPSMLGLLCAVAAGAAALGIAAFRRNRDERKER